MNENSNNIEQPTNKVSSFKKVVLWIKRLGFVGFIFFLIKGLLWLVVPYLIAMGLF